LSRRIAVRAEGGAGRPDPDRRWRLDKVAEILSIGLLRLNARMSSQKPTEFGESSLHFSADQSGDALPFSTGVSP
jgi:hypothetical protein